MPIIEIVLFFLVPLASIAGVIFYKKFPTIPQDHPLEEAIEDLVFTKTGIDIDLSPDTKEEQK
jgi:hypothetical protein